MKHKICDQSIKKTKQKLRDSTCDDIKIFDCVNHSYNRFLQFLFHCTVNVFQTENQIKTTKAFSSVDKTRYKKGIRKSFKRKQGL